MREMGYEGPIIGVTGNVLASHVETFVSHGANAVLPKPLVLNSLLRALEGENRDEQLVAAVAVSMICFCQQLFQLGMEMEFGTLFPAISVGIDFRHIDTILSISQ